MDSTNPCCAELKKKFQELKEGRNAVRKAVKLLQEQTNKLDSENKILKEQKTKLETENQRLSKVYKEELKQRNQDVEAKSKESILRSELEKEIQELKDEISSHQKHERVAGADKEERLLLINQISEKSAEIASLQELLEKEKKKVYVEKRKAEAEKAKAAEAWKLLKVEKSRTEEERKRLQNEKSCAEKQRHQLEKLKMEANEVREKWIAEKTKADKLYNQVEAEKQKANREKKRADSEKLKAEELKKLAEVEGKRAMDEKARADHFLQNLEVEKHEEMQKKIQGALSCYCGRPCYDGSKVESPSIKLLKEKLKLEKNKAKHYKKITKLQKAELSFVREELRLFKEHFRQISSRLNILDGHISSYIGGTDGLPKDTYVNVERCNVDGKSNFLLPRSCGNVPLGKRSEHGGFVLTGGSYTRLTSGTDSELDSPLGGSIRKKSQSSAVCSTTSTFTDRKLMGKQGADALMESKLTASAKNSNWRGSFVDPNFVTSNKKRRRNSEVSPKDNLGVFGHRNVKDVVEDAEPIFNNIRMGKNVEDSRESVEWMCSEHTPFHFKAGGKLPGITYCGKPRCAFAELFSEVQGKSDLQVGVNVLTGIDDVSFITKQPSSCCFEGMSSADYLKQLELDDQIDEYRYRSAMERPLSPTLPEFEFPCIRIDHGDDPCLLAEGLRGRCDADIDDPLPAPFIDVIALEVMSNDIRLKASNNHEMQTLHESVDSLHSSEVIPLQEDGTSILVNSGSLDNEKICNAGVPNNPQIDELISCTFKEVKTQGQAIDCMPSTQNNVVKNQIGCTIKEPNGSESSDAKHKPPATDQSNLNNTANAGITVEISDDKTELSPTNEEAVDPSTKKRETKRSVPNFIVYSSNKDGASTSRIIDIMNLFISVKVNDYYEGSMFEDVLHQLAAQKDLQSWERAVLFISCLLRTITAELLAFSNFIASAECYQFAGLFATDINRVISDQKTCQLVQEICGIDVLLNLSEEFLVSGKVLMQNDGQEQPLYPCVSSCKCSCLRVDCNVSERCATLEQFLSGCIIVASFCAATDRIGFLLELSYKILRWHTKENTFILPMLHVFAAISGKKFFDQESHNFLTDVIRTIVLIMEKGDNQDTALSVSSVIGSGAGLSFCVTGHCPFVAGALCMEDLAALLVNELKDHVVAQYELSSLNKRTSEELYLDPQSGSPGCSSNKFCCGLNHGGSCAEFSCCSRDDGFCNSVDIVSFLELIGCYMSWEWTYREVIIRLLKLLEICLCEVLSTSVFVLIGELSRFGIESGGFDRAGIPELGRTLCGYVNANIGKATISIQVAAIRALLHFLPLKFEEVVEECVELPPDATQSAICECIRKWFNQLNREYKTSVATAIRDVEALS